MARNGEGREQLARLVVEADRPPLSTVSSMASTVPPRAPSLATVTGMTKYSSYEPGPRPYCQLQPVKIISRGCLSMVS
jgi:hypothetical protein